MSSNHLYLNDILHFYGEDSNDFNVVEKGKDFFVYLTDKKKKVKRSLDSFGYCLSSMQNIQSHLSKEHAILEYGCATGFNLEYLRRNGFENVFGADSDRQYIETGRQRFKDLDIFVDDFKGRTCTRFKPDQFDIIFTRAVLQQKTAITQCPNVLKDREVVNVLKVFHTLLKSTGKLITVEGESVRDWPELFSQSGFKSESSKGDFRTWSPLLTKRRKLW